MKLLLLLLVSAFLAPLTTRPADVKVTGSTLRAIDDGYACVYQPLPNVRMEVFRGGPALPINPASDDQGKFRFGVPEGAPFRVLFYFDTTTVPQMQSLAGDATRTHNFHVAMLTVADYQRLAERRGLPPLPKYLQWILDTIPKDSKAAEVVRSILARLV